MPLDSGCKRVGCKLLVHTVCTLLPSIPLLWSRTVFGFLIGFPYFSACQNSKRFFFFSHHFAVIILWMYMATAFPLFRYFISSGILFLYSLTMPAYNISWREVEMRTKHMQISSNLWNGMEPWTPSQQPHVKKGAHLHLPAHSILCTVDNILR